MKKIIKRTTDSEVTYAGEGGNMGWVLSIDDATQFDPDLAIRCAFHARNAGFSGTIEIVDAPSTSVNLTDDEEDQ